MLLFQGLFLIAVGIGVLAVIYRSLSLGWLPCGSNWLRGRLKIWRDSQPLTYWFLFGLYTLGGLWATWYGIGVLAGNFAPLPVR